jgi:hypothetical protein
MLKFIMSAAISSFSVNRAMISHEPVWHEAESDHLAKLNGSIADIFLINQFNYLCHLP